jgi:hypothetical protein
MVGLQLSVQDVGANPDSRAPLLQNEARELRRHRASPDDDLRDGTEKLTNDDVSAEEIGIVVAQIRRLCRAAGLEFALRVGAVIIHHFYGGDANGWRSRGAKTASFRRLAAHPDLPLSPGSLYRCVALYELCDRLHAPSRWEHLGASHLRLVLGLPQSTQEKLLSTANAGRWSVKTLQREVLLGKGTRLTKGGRRAQSPITKSLMSVTKCLEGSRDAMDRTRLTSQDIERSLQLIEDAKLHLEYFSQFLQAASTVANEGADPTGKLTNGTEHGARGR